MAPGSSSMNTQVARRRPPRGGAPVTLSVYIMAKSKNGGAFQFLHGSIGSVTFSTSTMNIAGVRQQIARQKVTRVNNPNTVAQIMQRMKVSPAQRFFNAINSADATRLLEHSWEKLKYGNTGRLEFLRRALKAEGPYVPKGATRFVPAQYDIADGTLASVPVRAGSDGKIYVEKIPASFTSGVSAKETLTAWAGGDADAQVTLVMVTLMSDGTYVPSIERFIPSEMADGAAPAGFPLVYSESANYYGTPAGMVALAVIISKRDASGAWLRSPSQMVVNNQLYASLYSNDAAAAAVASYQYAGLNELGSDWYLNLANGQPFPGRLGLMSVADAATLLNGAQVVNGLETVGSSLVSSIFTVDGTEAGQAIVLADGVLTVLTGATATALAEYITFDNVVKWTAAMANQMGYAQSAALEAALNPEPEPRP